MRKLEWGWVIQSRWRGGINLHLIRGVRFIRAFIGLSFLLDYHRLLWEGSYWLNLIVFGSGEVLGLPPNVAPNCAIHAEPDMG